MKAPKPIRIALKKLGQVFCRHSFVLVIHRERMFLRCDSCGRETEGFQVGPKVGLDVVGRPRSSRP